MDFSKVKLKPTNTADSSAPKLHDAKKAEREAEEYRKQIEEQNIEFWYQALKSFTMITEFIPINQDLAEAIIRAFEKQALDESQTQLLTNVEHQIDNAINSIAGGKSGDQKGTFIRCSTRSPKDSRCSREKCRKVLLEELHKDTQQGENQNNRKMIALLKASLKGLYVQSGKEALNLLLSSARIHEDLCNERDKTIKTDQNIIIREWFDIPVEMEFRGFVKNKRFNAICQYYHTCYFPQLREKFDEAVERIQRFYEESIRDCLPLESCIIDFAVLPERILVIELNPFSIATDPALFSWKEDIGILENGPFTARRTEALPEVTKGIELAIKDLLGEE